MVTDDEVIATTTGNGVVATASNYPVGAITGTDDIFAVVIIIGALDVVEVGVTAPGKTPPDHAVVTDDNIITGACSDSVVTFAAKDHVVASAGGNGVVATQGGRTGKGRTVVDFTRNHARHGAVGEHYPALVTKDNIITRCTADHIRARSAKDYILATCTSDGVISAKLRIQRSGHLQDRVRVKQ